MVKRDLREILESSNDKLSVFADKATLANCDNLTNEMLFSLIDNFLSDSQKVVLLNFEHFRNLNSQIRANIAMSISDSNLRLQLLLTPNGPLSDFKNYQITDLVESLDDSCKLELLKNPSSVQNLELNKHSIVSIANSMSDDNKFSLLDNIDYVKEELKLDEYSISKILSSIDDEKSKLSLLNSIEMDSYYKANILLTLSDTSKASVLLNNVYGLKPYELSQVLGSMDTDFLIDYFNKCPDFLAKNKLSFQSVVKNLSPKKQVSFVSKINEINLEERRKKKNFSHITSRY